MSSDESESAAIHPVGAEVGMLPGERMVRIGALIGGIGAFVAVVALLPLVFEDLDLPPVLWFLAIGGVGLGVALALFGMVSSARARRRIVAGRNPAGQ